MPRIALVLLLTLVTGCPHGHPGGHPTGPTPGHGRPPSHLPPAPSKLPVSWVRVASPGDVPATPPAPGTWRVHLIDVGTGLSILVQGSDFALLYDAGSNDRDEQPVRVTSYLAVALGPSGDAMCGGPSPGPGQGQGGVGQGDRTIDHVVLSHPHFDHASALDLVLHCYAVKNVWDSGRVNQAKFYRDVLDGVASEPGVVYHTASPPPDDRRVEVKGFEVQFPAAVQWQTFSEGDQVQLGAGARMTLLHAEAKTLEDPNQNSIVVLVELGDVRLLLTGDAESGPREDPDAPLGDVEEHLVDHFAKEIRADILQVGHHGSKTSSRLGFLRAVHPSLALVSAGPKKYGRVVLPDREVIDALAQVGATVLRTDLHDGACPDAARIGPPDGPGGCDSYVITIGP